MALPAGGRSIGNGTVHSLSKNRLFGKDFIHRSAPKTWSADFFIAFRYQRDHSSAISVPSLNSQSLSLKIRMWFSNTTSKSHNSLPSPLELLRPWSRKMEA